jgi:hypothetical protein
MKLARLLGLGHTLAEAREILAGETLEGAECAQIMGNALPKLEARGVIGPQDFPLLRALVSIVVHGRPVDLPLDAFFGTLA